MIIGVLRTLPNNKWAVRFGNAWVEFFRNIPLLVQIFLWYHVIPRFSRRQIGFRLLCWWCWPWG